VRTTIVKSILSLARRTSQDTEDDDDETSVFIQCSIGRQQQDPLYIKVIVHPSRITYEPSSFDQLVVISLQCWEEILKQSDGVLLLDPLTQALSLRTSTMTLEVFCTRVKYWQVHGLWKEACEWNLQVLTKLVCTKLETGTSAAVKARDELSIENPTEATIQGKDPKNQCNAIEKRLEKRKNGTSFGHR
jgi:hypothetical protein